MLICTSMAASIWTWTWSVCEVFLLCGILSGGTTKWTRSKWNWSMGIYSKSGCSYQTNLSVIRLGKSGVGGWGYFRLKFSQKFANQLKKSYMWKFLGDGRRWSLRCSLRWGASRTIDRPGVVGGGYLPQMEAKLVTPMSNSAGWNPNIKMGVNSWKQVNRLHESGNIWNLAKIEFPHKIQIRPQNLNLHLRLLMPVYDS